jgi:hypothetical protein
LSSESSVPQHHHHEPGEGDPNAGPLMYAIAVGTVVTIATIIVIVALHDARAGKEWQAKVNSAGAVPEVLHLRSAQEAALASYRWIDRKAGLVSMPIDEAIQRVVRENGKAPAPPPVAPQTAPADGTPPQAPQPAPPNETQPGAAEHGT